MCLCALLAQLSNILKYYLLPAAHSAPALGRIFCVSIEDDTCGSLAVFSDFARSEDVAFLSSRVQKPHRLDYHTIFSVSKRSNSE